MSKIDMMGTLGTSIAGAGIVIIFLGVISSIGSKILSGENHSVGLLLIPFGFTMAIVGTIIAYWSSLEVDQ